MAKMYVWKVTLEVMVKFTVTDKEGKFIRSSKDVESVEFSVASPTGFKAIERAGVLALDKSNEDLDDWSDSDENFLSTPIKVMDVIGLSMESELDG